MLRRNVLIFHLGALGDFVLTWPLAMGLGRVFAQSRIFYVTHGQKGALAEDVLRVDARDIEGGWHQLYGDAPALPEPAVRLLDGAHAIFSFISTPDDIWTRNVRKLAPGAEVHVLRPTPPAEHAGHTTQYVLDQLGGAFIAQESMRQMLRSLEQRGVGSWRPVAGAPIVIHPGSGSPAKCWPLEHYLRLIESFKSAQQAVRVIVGEAEIERWGEGRIGAIAAVAEVVRPKTYVELAQVLMGASAFVGNDSGPGHLAGIMGLPTYCLFGPTDPAVWCPLGPRVYTRRSEPLAALSDEEVFHWVVGDGD